MCILAPLRACDDDSLRTLRVILDQLRLRDCYHHFNAVPRVGATSSKDMVNIYIVVDTARQTPPTVFSRRAGRLNERTDIWTTSGSFYAYPCTRAVPLLIPSACSHLTFYARCQRISTLISCSWWTTRSVAFTPLNKVWSQLPTERGSTGPVSRCPYHNTTPPHSRFSTRRYAPRNFTTAG